VSWAHLRGVKWLTLLWVAGFLLGAEFLSAAPTLQTADPDPMSGVPSREELRKRRARATNAPISFAINPVTQKLEARNIDGQIIEQYSTGTVGQVLDAGGYELRVSFGRDEKRRLSLMVRPGPAQTQPAQISVFERRLILPPGTSVSAAMEKEGGIVTIEPCLTGVIYYLDTEPTPVEVSPDKVRLVTSKNLVRIGREVGQGRLPDEEMIDAVVQGTLETEEKQTPQNNAGLAVGGWLQNATTSLMGLPNPQAAPPATVVKVSAGTPELSAPANAAVTPNTDMKPVVTDRNVGTTPVTQSVKVIALRGRRSGGAAAAVLLRGGEPAGFGESLAAGNEAPTVGGPQPGPACAGRDFEPEAAWGRGGQRGVEGSAFFLRHARSHHRSARGGSLVRGESIALMNELSLPILWGRPGGSASIGCVEGTNL